MPEQNEPTTGEIVLEARRVMLDAWGCAGCDLRTVLRQAVDRLESQERELLQKTQALEDAKQRHAKKDAEAAELYEKAIARAESAERERVEAVNALTFYEDALIDECDESYQSGFMDGLRSREEIDDED